MKENLPIPGQPIEEMTPEQLKAEQVRVAEEKRRIIRLLNQIKHPINATVFYGPGPWTIRNTAFWQMMQKHDDSVVEFMDKFLTENK